MEYDLGEDRNMCRFNCCPYWDFEQEKCIYTSCKRLNNELDNSKRGKAHFIYV